MWWIFGVVLGVILGALAYVRFAPSDVERWHRLPDAPTRGKVIEVADGWPQLARLDEIAMAWPGTQRLAGSVSEGMITYVTRSDWVGFPDYTTVAERDGKLVLWARQRFGTEDFGVNAKRLRAWRQSLAEGGPPKAD